MKQIKSTILLIISIAGLVCTAPELNAQTQQTTAQTPTVQLIRRDLTGRTIVEPTRKRYRGKFEIKSINNVLNVEITGRETRKNEILYQTRLKLSDRINTYMATVDITYHWNGKAWVIQYLQSKSLDIVSTGKFRNCILVKSENVMFTQHLIFYNNCDVTLLVEGRVFTWGSSGRQKEWVDFSIPVPANGNVDFRYETDVEYQITRVERP